MDGTLLMALSTIKVQQANLTNSTMAQAKQLLDYCVMHKDAVTYQVSNMLIMVHSDVSYLNEKMHLAEQGCISTSQCRISLKL